MKKLEAIFSAISMAKFQIQFEELPFKEWFNCWEHFYKYQTSVIYEIEYNAKMLNKSNNPMKKTNTTETKECYNRYKVLLYYFIK